MNIIEMAEMLSKLIWDWMKITKDIPHGSATETGMTSYLIYSLSKSKDFGKLFTFKNTKKKESITGADFYLVIYNRSKVKKYLVQAKKMYPADKQDIRKNKYKEFNHKVSLKYQFNILTAYCSKNSFIPLYCFYNSSFNQPFDPQQNAKLNLPKMKLIDSEYTQSSQDVLGVTISYANEIKNLFRAGNIRNISFEESLELASTVSLQEFFRVNGMGSSNTEENDFKLDNTLRQSDEDQKIKVYEDKKVTNYNETVNSKENKFASSNGIQFSQESIYLYEQLDEVGRKIIDGIIKVNSEALPIIMYNIDTGI